MDGSRVYAEREFANVTHTSPGTLMHAGLFRQGPTLPLLLLKWVMRIPGGFT